MNSIRQFLMWSLLLSMTVVMSIAGIYSYKVSMHEVDEVFDAQLAQYAKLIAGYQRSHNGVSPQAIEIFPTAIGHKYESKIVFQIWDAGHLLLGRSANAGTEPLGPLTEGFHRVTGSDHKPWQVFVLHDMEQHRWYMAGEKIEIRHELVQAIALTAIFPLIAGTLVTLLLIRMFLLRGLRSLSDIATAIVSRKAGDLSPLAFDKIPLEIQPLVDNLNALLGRVRESLERERHFSADAAHEIKTPLAALKLHLSNLQASAGNPDPDILNKALRSCNDIQRIVDQLLVFNRLEPQYFAGKFEPLDLSVACRDVMAQEAEPGLAKHLELQFHDAPEPIMIGSEPTMLAMLLRNLVHNAVIYTQPHGLISLRLSREGPLAVIRLDDNGPGIPVAERARVFERFYRVGGDSHASGAPGCGLGLSIAREIVRLHGGQIELADSAFGTGLAVMVRLPLYRS